MNRLQTHMDIITKGINIKLMQIKIRSFGEMIIT